MKTFIGSDGYYEINDNGSVIQKMVDSLGRFTGILKKYKDANKIPNHSDRESVLNLLRLLRVYKLGGRC